MKCPQCNSAKIIKNGYRRGKQSYRCRHCNRQFVESPANQRYPQEVKQLCLKMYLNGMGLRGIERVTEIHHTTITGNQELCYGRLAITKWPAHARSPQEAPKAIAVVKLSNAFG